MKQNTCQSQQTKWKKNKDKYEYIYKLYIILIIT